MTIEVSKTNLIWLLAKLNEIENDIDNELDYLTSKELYTQFLEALNQCEAYEELRKF